MVFIGVMIYPFPMYYIYILTILLIIISIIAWLFLYDGLNFFQKPKPTFPTIKKFPSKWAAKDFSYKSLENEVDNKILLMVISITMSLKIFVLVCYYWEKLDTLLFITSFIGTLPLTVPLIANIYFTIKYWGETYED